MATFDPETLERWKGMEPKAIYLEVVDALHRTGAVTSAEFLDAFEDLVDEGLLTWEGIEALEGS